MSRRGGPEAALIDRGGGQRGGDRFGGGGWSGHGDYFSHKNDQLREQYNSKVTIVSDVFRGLLVHVDGMTETPKDELADLVTQHGGTYSQYPGRGLTHFVVNNIPVCKIKQWMSEKKLLKLHVVHERWVLESARQRRRLPEGDFLLPELLHPRQPGLRGFVVASTGPAQAPAASALPLLPSGESAPSATPAAAAPEVDCSRTRVTPEASQGPRPGEVAAPAGSAGIQTPASSDAHQRLRVGVGGLVIHIDVDAMFAQCHQVDNPQACPRGRPLAVQQHHDIIAVNHLAKACGVVKHMEPAEARRRIAEQHGGWNGGVVHVPTDAVGRVTYRLYQMHSAALMAVWEEVSLSFEPEAVLERHTSSYDEAFIDSATGSEQRAIDLAQRLRSRSADLGFSVSIGIARNKPLAKFASLAAKPQRGGRGLCAAVDTAAVEALLSATPLTALPKRLRPGPLEQRLRGVVQLTSASALSVRDVRRLQRDASNGELRRLFEATDAAAAAQGSARTVATCADTAQQLADELWGLCHGKVSSNAEAVRELPPRERIQIACSLSVVPTHRVGGSTAPVRVDDQLALRPWVESVSLELLQRAALHRWQHQLVPQRVEIGLQLLHPSLAGCAADCGRCGVGRACRADPSDRHCSTCALCEPVIAALQHEQLRYEADASERAMGVAMRNLCGQVLPAMRTLARAHVWNGKPAASCFIKRFSLTLLSFKPVSPAKSSLRSFLLPPPPSSVTPAVEEGGKHGGPAPQSLTPAVSLPRPEKATVVASTSATNGSGPSVPKPDAPRKADATSGFLSARPAVDACPRAVGSLSCIDETPMQHRPVTAAETPHSAEMELHPRRAAAVRMEGKPYAVASAIESSSAHRIRDVDAQLVDEESAGAVGAPGTVAGGKGPDASAVDLGFELNSTGTDVEPDETATDVEPDAFADDSDQKANVTDVEPDFDALDDAPEDPAKEAGRLASSLAAKADANGSAIERAACTTGCDSNAATSNPGPGVAFEATDAGAEGISIRPGASAVAADGPAVGELERRSTRAADGVADAIDDTTRARSPGVSPDLTDPLRAHMPPSKRARIGGAEGDSWHLSLRCGSADAAHGSHVPRQLERLLDHLQIHFPQTRMHALADDEAVTLVAVPGYNVLELEAGISTGAGAFARAGGSPWSESTSGVSSCDWSIGVAQTLPIARLAASNALAQPASQRFHWLRGGDERELLRRRPVSALIPTLSARECAELLDEGVATCCALLNLGYAKLNLRYRGRVEHIMRRAVSGRMFPPRLPPPLMPLLDRDCCAMPSVGDASGMEEGTSVSDLETAASAAADGKATAQAAPQRAHPPSERSAQDSASRPSVELDLPDAVVGQEQPAAQADDAVAGSLSRGESLGVDAHQFFDDPGLEVGGDQWVDNAVEMDDSNDEAVAESPQRSTHSHTAAGRQMEAQPIPPIVRNDMVDDLALPSVSQVAPEVFSGAWGSELQQLYERRMEAKQRAEQLGAAAAGSSSWTCAECTYINGKLEYLQCEMCDALRPYQQLTPAQVEMSCELAASEAGRPFSTVRPAPSRGGHRGSSSRSARCASRDAAAAPRRSRSDFAADRSIDSAAAEVAPFCCEHSMEVQSCNPSAAGVADPLPRREEQLDDWMTVLPQLQGWIESDDNPPAEPLLSYAKSLVAAGQLEELSYLARFLARACSCRPTWHDALSSFVDCVDALIQGRYGSSFKPLQDLRLVLTRVETSVGETCQKAHGP